MHNAIIVERDINLRIRTDNIRDNLFYYMCSICRQKPNKAAHRKPIFGKVCTKYV